MVEATLNGAIEDAMMSQAQEIGRLTNELRQASELRRSTIDAMRQATRSMLTACATARGEMAHDYRMQAHKFLSSLTRDVAAHRRASANQMAKRQKFLDSMAKDMAADRNATMNHIARTANARNKAASRLRGSLRRQVVAIVEQTREFRNAAAQIVPALAGAHQKMAKHQRASLEAGHRKLHANMTRVLGAIHADRMKAHEIWSNFKLGGVA
jgi:hypothetical protein